MTVRPIDKTYQLTNSKKGKIEMMRLKRKILYFAAVAFVTMFFTICIFAAEVKQGDKITIITPGTVARLCPYANCGSNDHITRIPEKTVLEVSGIIDVKLPAWSVKWFEVTYKGKRGWVSIFDTDKQ